MLLDGVANVKRNRGNPGTTKTKKKYKDIVCAFDIETTALSEINQAVLYVWMFQLGNRETIVGRTWEEFLHLLHRLRDELSSNEYLVVYVHNLSYEFQFLRGIYNFHPEEVFAVEPRKVLKCEMFEHFEFRCSYLHSNMSLKEYTEKMGVKHVKQSGAAFDYTKRRYPWTELTPSEWRYCIHDVKGLVEALQTEMNHDGDTLYSIPLTSTGYVRRDVKESMREINHNFVKEQLPDYRIYQMLREAFRGGDTHANRYYAGQILHDVKSADMSSAYPAAVCNCEFPISEFTYMGEQSPAYVAKLINVRKKAIVCRAVLDDLELKDPFNGAPYLSESKCSAIINGVFDNGRVLRADHLETTLTDIDLRIVLEEYHCKIGFAEVAYARYGKLPNPLIETVEEYYRLKTQLKGVDGQEVYYMKSKNKLNSIYGMMAQDPVKQTIDFINGDFERRSEPGEELLEASNKKAFLAYQWGVWVTAHVRARLRIGIRKAGRGFVYCDTDSVKYLGDVDFSDYNDERQHESLYNGAYADDPGGNRHFMGVYEDDGHYAAFATLGAKKYCYQYTPDGETHCTIAGVNKRKGGKELDKHGGITAFKPGFVFRDAGGTESVYNDRPEITSYEVDGHTLRITSNVLIRDSEYTLGIAPSYEKILSDAKIYKESIDIIRNMC